MWETLSPTSTSSQDLFGQIFSSLLYSLRMLAFGDPKFITESLIQLCILYGPGLFVSCPQIWLLKTLTLGTRNLQIPPGLHWLQCWLTNFFFFFFGCVGSSLLRTGFLQLRRAVCGLLIAVASLVAEHGLQACRLQQFWLMGSRAQAQQLWLTGLVASRHVGSFRTRARTRVPCIGRRILNH